MSECWTCRHLGSPDCICNDQPDQEETDPEEPRNNKRWPGYHLAS